MATSEIDVVVTTSMDRPEPFAELFVGRLQWAEVALARDGSSRITLFPPLDGQPYEFHLVEVKAALEEAESRLRKLEGE